MASAGSNFIRKKPSKNLHIIPDPSEMDYEAQARRPVLFHSFAGSSGDNMEERNQPDHVHRDWQSEILETAKSAKAKPQQRKRVRTSTPAAKSSEKPGDVTEAFEEITQPEDHVDLDRQSEIIEEAIKPKRKRGKTSTQPAKSSEKPKKFAWSSDLVELLLKYIREYKTKCDFNGTDFEQDQQQMYTEVRSLLAVDHPESFGPVKYTEADIELRDMEKQEYEDFQALRNEEKKSTRVGYGRVKEKVSSRDSPTRRVCM